MLAPAAALDDGDGSQVRDASGRLHAAELLGADPSSGFAVLKVPGLTVKPPIAGERARPGQLAVALGRTWSGAPRGERGIVSVVGGPLRTGRGRDRRSPAGSTSASTRSVPAVRWWTLMGVRWR